MASSIVRAFSRARRGWLDWARSGAPPGYTNLDRQSTNHAHADFWLATKDNSIQGPKHSINVLSDVIMLYKPGASGRRLGAIDTFGPAELDALLASAAEEFGQMMEEANV